MALNALAALLAAIGGRARDAETVLDGLAGFEGVRRRFELVGTAARRAGLRRLRPPSDRGARHADGAAGGGRAERARPVDRGVPAPLVFAHSRLSRASSARRSSVPTRCSCSTCTRRGNSRWQASAVRSVAEHVSVPVHYVPDFSAVADLVADAARPGDVVVDDGRRRRHDAGPGDPERCSAEPTARAATRSETGAHDERRTAARRRPNPTGRRRRGHRRPDEDAGRRRGGDRTRDRRRRLRGSAAAGPARTRGAPRGPGPRDARSSTPAARPSGGSQGTSAGRSRNPLARGGVRGLKVLMWSALVSVSSSGLGLLLYFTPIMSARNVVITGLGAVTQDEVDRRRGRPAGHAAAAGRHRRRRRTRRDDPPGGHARGCSASTRRRCGSPSSSGFRSWSRTIPTARTCSTATASISRPRRRRPACRIWTPTTPGPNDPPTKAALQVLTALRPEVAGQVGRIAAPSVASITLTLVDGRVVIWGTTDRTEEKALKLGGAADPARPHLRRVEPGSADGQVIRRRAVTRNS